MMKSSDNKYKNETYLRVDGDGDGLPELRDLTGTGPGSVQWAARLAGLLLRLLWPTGLLLLLRATLLLWSGLLPRCDG